MGIDHGRLHIALAEEFLNGWNVVRVVVEELYAPRGAWRSPLLIATFYNILPGAVKPCLRAVLGGDGSADYNHYSAPTSEGVADVIGLSTDTAVSTNDPA